MEVPAVPLILPSLAVSALAPIVIWALWPRRCAALRERLGLAQCSALSPTIGSTARTISPIPPTSSTSISIRLNSDVSRICTSMLAMIPVTMISAPRPVRQRPASDRPS